MITYSAAFAAAVSTPNCLKSWLLTIAFGGSPSGALQFSTARRKLGTKTWRAGVKSWGRIDEKIDLKKSDGKIGDITIVLHNEYPNADGTLTSELFGASKYFENQDVTIEEWVPGIEYSDLHTIYYGRLKQIKHNIKTDLVSLIIEERTPWDLIMIPQIKTAEGKYFPVVYGSYEPEESTVAVPQYCKNAVVWPMPVNEVAGSFIYCLVHAAIAANGGAHYFDKNLDEFIPLDTIDVASQAYGDGYAILGDADLERGFKWNDVTEGAASEWDDFANLIDTGTDWCSKTHTNTTPETSDIYDLLLDVRQPDGFPTSVTVRFDYEIEITSYSGTNVGLSLYYVVGGDATLVASRDQSDGVGTTSGTYELDITSYCISGIIPVVKLWGNWACSVPSNPTDEVVGTMRVNSIEVEGTYSINTDEPEAVNSKLQGLKYLYSGSDGFDKSYTGYSGTCNKIHQIFRDILCRYVDIDYADDSAADVDIAGWNALETARTGYTARLYHDKPVALSTIFKRLQFAGAFIFQMRNAAARVVFVRSSYSAGNVDIAFNAKKTLEITGVYRDDINSIVTSRTYHYGKHSATGEYTSSVVKTNSNRENYNYGSVSTDAENQEEINVEYLNNATDVADIYDMINGEPRTWVDAIVLDKAYHYVEYGDTVTLSNMPCTSLSGGWTGKYFMVTHCKRSPSEVVITMREVG